MEKNNKGINVSAPIVPYTDKDIYPTHKAIYGKGGWKSVKNLEELKAIPSSRLEDGCIVRVVELESGSSVEFYYDSKIKLGTAAPESIKDPIEREVYPYCFRKWAPGYLPTKVSDLENDEYFIAEVHDKVGGKYKYLNPFPEDGDTTKLESILKSRARGIYQELALSFLFKNTHTTLSLDDSNEDGLVDEKDKKTNIYGLVTVDDTGKVPNELLEFPGKYVETIDAIFPDDFCEFPLDPAAYFVYIDGKPSRFDSEGNLVTSNTPGRQQSAALEMDKPRTASKGQKYYITEYYMYGSKEESYNADRNKVAVITSSDDSREVTWLTSNPILNDIIYVNKFRRTAFIIEEKGLITEKSIGRDLIRTIEELKIPSTIIDIPTEWDHYGISAKVAYQILLEIDKIIAWGDGISGEMDERKRADAEINARIDKLQEKLNAHLQDKRNPHEVTRKQLGIDVDDEVTFSKVIANGFFMSDKKTVSDEPRTIQEDILKESLVVKEISSIPQSIEISRSISPIRIRSSKGNGGFEWETELEIERQERIEADQKLNARLDELEATLDGHIARKDNPHETNRGHLRINTTDSVTFSKVNAPNGFFQESGVAAVFKLAEEDTVDSKLASLEETIKELNKEIEKLKRRGV